MGATLTALTIILLIVYVFLSIYLGVLVGEKRLQQNKPYAFGYYFSTCIGMLSIPVLLVTLYHDLM